MDGYCIIRRSGLHLFRIHFLKHHWRLHLHRWRWLAWWEWWIKSNDWSKEDTYLSGLHLSGAFIGGILKLGHIAGWHFAYHSYISLGAIRFRYLFGFGGFCDKLTLV